MKLSDMTKCALMSIIISICAWISIPSIIPFTLQSFGIYFCLLLLGSKNSFWTIFLYLTMGIIGIPVFSHFTCGIQVLLGPTGGYLVGFLAEPLVFALVMRVRKESNHNKILKIIALTASTLVCYMFGTFWYVFSTGAGFSSAMILCVVPFIVPDTLKIILAILLSDKIKITKEKSN